MPISRRGLVATGFAAASAPALAASAPVFPNAAAWTRVSPAAAGLWAGRRLVSEAYVTAMTQPSQTLNPSYGLVWWLNSKPGYTFTGQGERALRFPGAPSDAVAALGAGGQAVMIVPSRDLVVVRQGTNPPETMLPNLLAETVKALRHGT